jgi:hypothetical protein
VRHAARALAAATLAFSTAAFAQADPCSSGDATLRAQAGSHAVRFRMVPQPAVGRHFAVVFAVCGAAGVAKPDSISVDARMPAHGHGMNYRPTITALDDGRYRADGLMFHMPGRWELSFVVREGGASEHITYMFDLK